MPLTKASPNVNGIRRPSDMITNQLANLGQQTETGESPRRPADSRGGLHSIFDPSLLQDLAEGFEFLNRQLDDSDTELERSREQSRAFEQDARRWEEEASRLREEAEQTRSALDKLRQDFDVSRDDSHRQQHAVEQILGEMSEVRAARAHLEGLAAEQQRALVLSLELLKRVSTEEGVPAAETQFSSVEVEAKDREIADLKRILEAAGDEGTRVDHELAIANANLESRNAEWEAAQDKIRSLQFELDAVQTELASVRTESSTAESLLQAANAELSRLEEEAKSVEPLPASSGARPDLIAKLAELEQEKTLALERLQYADSEIALQNAEVESRGAIITALESALEEQNASLRTLEERFLAYAEQVQSLQLERLEMPGSRVKGIAAKFAQIFSPPKRVRMKEE
ncbi:MAG TPA: hypothetical protein VGL53_18060 [Bryobacteraceae bacterium]|jgi:chromosome segregation ATPase